MTGTAITALTHLQPFIDRVKAHPRRLDELRSQIEKVCE